MTLRNEDGMDGESGAVMDRGFHKGTKKEKKEEKVVLEPKSEDGFSVAKHKRDGENRVESQKCLKESKRRKKKREKNKGTTPRCCSSLPRAIVCPPPHSPTIAEQNIQKDVPSPISTLLPLDRVANMHGRG